MYCLLCLSMSLTCTTHKGWRLGSTRVIFTHLLEVEGGECAGKGLEGLFL